MLKCVTARACRDHGSYETAILFSRLVVPFHVPIIDVRVTCFLSILASIWHYDYFLSHPGRYAPIAHEGFPLYFPNGWWWWANFHVLICHLYTFSSEMSIRVFCPYNWTVCFLEFQGFLGHSRYKPFAEYVVFRYFLTVCSPSFYPLNRVFCRGKF